MHSPLDPVHCHYLVFVNIVQVKENEGKLQEAQKCLCDCSDKVMMFSSLAEAKQ